MTDRTIGQKRANRIQPEFAPIGVAASDIAKFRAKTAELFDILESLRKSGSDEQRRYADLAITNLEIGLGFSILSANS